LALRLADRDRATLEELSKAWGVPAGAVIWALVAPVLRRVERGSMRLRPAELALRALVVGGYIRLEALEELAAMLRDRGEA
jgi:hypothetical protein